jgi:hypothetical protein
MGFVFVLPTHYNFLMIFSPRHHHNKEYASTFTGTGTAEFTGFRGRDNGLTTQFNVFCHNLLPWAYLLEGLFRN